MSEEYDLWNDPDICLDTCCIIDGQGDPAPGVAEGGAIPDDPDADGHLDGWVDS